MKIILTISILFLTAIAWAQNPLFKDYVGLDHLSISEFEDFKDYEDFGGMMIGTDLEGTEYGFSHYGKEGSEIIVFETVRTVNRKGVYTLIDGLIIKTLDSDQYLMYGQCMIDGEDNSFIVAIYESEKLDEENFTNIIKAWRANPKKGRFESIKTKSISCYNEGFGCGE